MKKIYNKPFIKIVNINLENILDISIYINNSYNDEYIIKNSSEILVNKNSVWDEN